MLYVSSWVVVLTVPACGMLASRLPRRLGYTNSKATDICRAQHLDYRDFGAHAGATGTLTIEVVCAIHWSLAVLCFAAFGCLAMGHLIPGCLIQALSISVSLSSASITV